jgi:peptidoglycan/xylan/chitin deacetylase (PgdA/CDA1 family)
MKLVIFILLAVINLFPQEKFLGGIIRGDRAEKIIHLLFTSHEFIDGFETIVPVLEKQGVKASFFFTGDFYRTAEFVDVIKTLNSKGHYLGAHSDKHLLYCSWENRDSTLITKEEFNNDLLNNYTAMASFGITKSDASFYLPPYEWYNSQISAWTEELGFTLINFTPGTSSNQDWTVPNGSFYYSSDSLYNKILSYEENNEDRLNGFLLLLHFGTHPDRTDKFYYKLDKLITELKARGYIFKLPTETFINR